MPFRIVLFLVVLFSASPAAFPQELPVVVERYEQMLMRSPGPGRAFDQVYQHFFSNQGLDALHQRWEGLKEEADDSTRAGLDLLQGLLAKRRGEIERAAERFRASVEVNPDNYQAWVALGELELARGELGKGIEALRKATELETPFIEMQDIYVQLARAQQRNFDEAGALETYRKLAGEFPDDPFVLREVSEALVEAEMYEEAKKIIGTLEELSQGDAYQTVLARMRLAAIEERLDNVKAAIGIYDQSLDLVHPSSWLYRELISRIENIYRRSDDLKGLVAYFRDRAENKGRDIDTALRLADLLLELNELESSLEWLNKAAAWAPDREDIQADIGFLLMTQGQYEAATEVFQKLVRTNPDDWGYREALGESLWRQFEATEDESKKAEAVAAWSQLAPEGAEDVSRVNALGDLYRRFGLADLAEEEYQRAISLSPESFDLRERMALFLFSREKNDKAWMILEEFEDHDPKPNYHLRLAQFQKRYGRAEKSLGTVEKGLALEPGHYNLLDFKLRTLMEQEEWAKAEVFFPRVEAAAPNEYFKEDLEARYVALLQSSGKFDALREAWYQSLANGAELPQRETRLLARMEMDGGDKERAEEIFDVARERFPGGFLLAKLETNFLARHGSVEEQVAAWRRLIQLRPERIAEWMRQIVLAYKSHNRVEEALESANQMLNMFPADPQAHILKADLLQMANKPRESNDSLRRAIELAANPNDIRIRLAASLAEQGSTEEAIDLYFKAFESADNFNTRRSLVRQLVELYLSDGDLSELVEVFKNKQMQSASGWDYHLLLAEVYLQAKDSASAREELKKALTYRKTDPKLLTQLVALAKAEADVEAWLKHARALSRVDPSVENDIDLAKALIANEEGKEALKVVGLRINEIMDDSATMRQFYPQLATLGQAEAFRELLLRNFRTQGGGWRSMMALAEFFLSQNDLESAKTILWEVLGETAEVQSASVAAQSQVLRARQNTEVYPEDKLMSKIRLGHQARRNFQELITSATDSGSQGAALPNAVLVQRLTSTPGLSSASSPSQSFAGSVVATSLDEGQVAALVYLAGISALQDRSDLFVQQLDDMLTAMEADWRGRILAFGVVSALDQFFAEIENMLEANAPYDTELYLFCYRALTGTLYNSGGYRVEGAVVEPLIGRLEESILLRDPDEAPRVLLSKIIQLAQMGELERALSTLEEHQSVLEQNDSNQLIYLISMLLQNNYLEEALPLIERQMELAEADPSSGVMNRLGNILATYFKAMVATGNESEKVSDLFERLLLTGARMDGETEGMPVAEQSDLRYINQYSNFPFQNGYFSNNTINTLRQLVEISLGTERHSFLIDRLEELEAEAEGDDRITVKLLRTHALWFLEDFENAAELMRQIHETEQNDDTRIMLAMMLRSLGKHPEAQELMSEIEAGSGVAHVFKLINQYKVYRETAPEKAKEAVLELASLHAPSTRDFNLQAAMQELKLDEVARPQSGSPNPFQSTSVASMQWHQIRERLQRLRNGNQTEEATRLAFQVLKKVPMGTPGSQQERSRREALNHLATEGLIEDYLADLQRQLKAAPDSLRLLQRLAEGTQIAEQQEDREVGANNTTSQTAFGLPVSLHWEYRTQDPDETVITDELRRWAPAVRPEMTYSFKPSPDHSFRYATAFPLPDVPEVVDGMDQYYLENPKAVTFDADRVVKSLEEVRRFHIPEPEEDLVGHVNLESYLRYHQGKPQLYKVPFKVSAPEARTEITRRIKEWARQPMHFYVPPPLDPESSDPDRPLNRGLLIAQPLEPRTQGTMVYNPSGDIGAALLGRKGVRSLDYLRRIHELRPGDDTYTNLLLNRLWNEKKFDEMTALYDQQLDIDLHGTLTKYNNLANTYHRAERIEDLVRRIENASYPPVQLRRVGVFGRDSIHRLQTIGSLLNRLGHKNAAMRVWKKALEVTALDESFPVRKDYVEELLRGDGNDDELYRVLKEYLLPEIYQRDDTLWVRGQGDNSLPGWITFIQHSNNTFRSQVYQLLMQVAAENNAVLERLLAHTREYIESGDELEKVAGRTLALTLSVVLPGKDEMAELAKLRELVESADGNDANHYRDALYPKLLPFLLSNIDEYGEGDELIVDILWDSVHRSDLNRNQYYERVPVRMLAVDIAREIGMGEEARKFARSLHNVLFEQSIQSGNYDFNKSMALLDIMMDLRMIEDAETFVDRLARSKTVKGNSTYQRRIEQVRRQLKLLNGRSEDVSVTLWQLPGDDPGRVHWEIGTASSDIRSPLVSGQDMEIVNGQYDLYVVALDQNEEQIELAHFTSVPARGDREVDFGGRRFGYVQGILKRRTDGRTFGGPKFFFVTVPNLIKNPDMVEEVKPGQWAVNTEGWSFDGSAEIRREDVLNSGSPHVFFQGTSTVSSVVEGEPVPIHEAADYVYAGWFRRQNNAFFRIGRRYLDADKNPIRTRYSQTVEEGEGWTRIRYILSSTERDYGRQETIPEGTAFIQPVLMIRNGVEWRGLYLGELHREVPPPLDDSAEEVQF